MNADTRNESPPSITPTNQPPSIDFDTPISLPDIKSNLINDLPPVDASLSKAIDEVFTEIVRCDDQYCPHLDTMHSQALFLLLEAEMPDLHEKLLLCHEPLRVEPELSPYIPPPIGAPTRNRSEKPLSSPPPTTDQTRLPFVECRSMFLDALQKVQPILYSALDRRREAISTEPLQNYDGFDYQSPFWFEGAGDLWRRKTHGSNRITPRNCMQLKQQARLCLANPQKESRECFLPLASSLTCVAGLNCPDLRLPMIQCIVDSSTAVGNFQKFQDCLSNVAHFKQCSIEDYEGSDNDQQNLQQTGGDSSPNNAKTVDTVKKELRRRFIRD